MQPKLKLSIAEPCHENWQNMNPTEQGRHCSSCAKEVIDFTLMSDTEVLNYFIDRKKQNVCGRFYNDQLNREIKKPEYGKTKMMWYWNYLVMFFLLLVKTNATRSQTVVEQHPLEQQSKNNIDSQLKGVVGGVSIIKDKNFDVSGKITDRKGLPIAGVSIIIKGKKIGTSTNADGMYRLESVGTKDVLVVSSVGYERKEIKINSLGSNDCVLQEAVIGEVITVGYVISRDDDYSPPAIPTHVAVIEVRDNKTSEPIKATLTIKKDDNYKESISSTDKNGIYKLRRIKETENYTVTVSAQGYKDSVLQIKGCNFYDRKETKYVFLEKEQTGVLSDKPAVIRMGMVSAHRPDPLYVVDGEVTDKNILYSINPAEIETFDILKDASATTLYGSRGAYGVIIITTKKKKDRIEVPRPVVEEKKKLATQANDGNIKITPNPVQKGNSFNLSFTTKQGQDYVIQIFTIGGMLMQTKKITAKANDAVLQLQTGSNWSAGIYYVRVNDEKGNSVYTLNFVVE